MVAGDWWRQAGVCLVGMESQLSKVTGSVDAGGDGCTALGMNPMPLAGTLND